MGHKPTHPQLLSMKEVFRWSALKTQVDSKRKNTDESNLVKKNIIKEMF